MQDTFIEKQVYMSGVIGSYITREGEKGLVTANFLALFICVYLGEPIKWLL